MSLFPISLPHGDPSAVLVPPLQRVVAGEYERRANDDDKDDRERPLQRVVIARDFFLGVYPVTVAEFRSFRSDHGPGEDERWPVAGVSWRDAADYCTWLAEMTGDAWRLPTEAEWEYAAYASGDVISVPEANKDSAEQGHRVGLGRRTDVGSDPANAFGLHDLPGQVGEWVQDRWHPTEEGLTGEDDRRVFRCGAENELLHHSRRDALPETASRDNLGFRAACDIP